MDIIFKSWDLGVLGVVGLIWLLSYTPKNTGYRRGNFYDSFHWKRGNRYVS
jgi:hypothetical protein